MFWNLKIDEFWKQGTRKLFRNETKYVFVMFFATNSAWVHDFVTISLLKIVRKPSCRGIFKISKMSCWRNFQQLRFVKSTLGGDSICIFPLIVKNKCHKFIQKYSGLFWNAHTLFDSNLLTYFSYIVQSQVNFLQWINVSPLKNIYFFCKKIDFHIMNFKTIIQTPNS